MQLLAVQQQLQKQIRGIQQREACDCDASRRLRDEWQQTREQLLVELHSQGMQVYTLYKYS